jgi:hypothetical protein
MTITLIDGETVACSLVPGKRYVLQISGEPPDPVMISPLQTIAGAATPGTPFSATADAVGHIIWSFTDGVYQSAGFEFTATRNELTLQCDGAFNVNVECYPIES